MMKSSITTLLAAMMLVAPTQSAIAQKANTACVWSLARMVQLFEELCHPDEHSDYRATLNESVAALHARTKELGTVADIDRVSNDMKGSLEGEFAKQPTFCQRGHLFDMSRAMRGKGIERIKQDTANTLAVPRERQVNGCL
ncbi:hypothetical protein [Microvirga splendida]|uniref:Uncharacterized protein n=1 Tax=Microvirga splendida TaxID=2795727 RepID=A0ABS0Y183_9HYPH|nr:hypothetical protein [Microvirga splendida]MBJ6126062.1 hypothetical protein [Microvirga splendida]